MYRPGATNRLNYSLDSSFHSVAIAPDDALRHVYNPHISFDGVGCIILFSPGASVWIAARLIIHTIVVGYLVAKFESLVKMFESRVYTIIRLKILPLISKSPGWSIKNIKRWKWPKLEGTNHFERNSNNWKIQNRTNYIKLDSHLNCFCQVKSDRKEM
jgi:hypothetical protein